MDYPSAPWHTYGRAFVQPFLVVAKELRVPAGFTPITFAGRAVGLLGLVEYRPPSPLVYAELVWMPCLVHAAGARGYFVNKMYVDSDASLAGGREIWSLPKQKARFSIAEHTATIETEDGAHLMLELRQRGPAVKTAAGAATLQDGDEHIVRFRGTGTTRIRSGGLRIREAKGLEHWVGLTGARRIPGLGMALDDFSITMHAAKHLARS